MDAGVGVHVCVNWVYSIQKNRTSQLNSKNATARISLYSNWICPMPECLLHICRFFHLITIFFILSSLHNFLVGSTQSKNSFYFVFNFITACAVLSIDKFNLQWNQLIRFLCLFLLQLTGMRLALYCVMYGWL